VVDYTNHRLYVCNRATRGWDYVDLTGRFPLLRPVHELGHEPGRAILVEQLIQGGAAAASSVHDSPKEPALSNSLTDVARIVSAPNSLSPEILIETGSK